MIGIVNYGIGNVGSVANIMDAHEIPHRLIETQDDFREVDRIILPGVGSFDAAMRKLRASGLIEPLEDAVRVRRVPVLGLCLGMQMMFEGSAEGDHSGLGWLPGQIVAFDRTALGAGVPVPHMSWARVHSVNPHALTEALSPPARFYFAHSYHVRTEDRAVVIAQATYGYPFPAVVGRGNIVGVQFHPEKSRQFGAHLLKRFTREDFA